MKDLGDYSFEIERAGTKFRAAARGYVAIISVAAAVGLVALYLFTH